MVFSHSLLDKWFWEISAAEKGRCPLIDIYYIYIYDLEEVESTFDSPLYLGSAPFLTVRENHH